jgi:predicted nuclease with TOPRIM domain
VRELTDKVNQNTTKTSKITELESKISELTQKINDLQTSGGTNTTKVTELTNKVAQLETKNQQLETKVTDLTQKLTQLITKVDGLEAKLPFFGSFTMNGTAAEHSDTKVTEGTFLSYNISGEVKGQTLDLSVETGKIKAASDASENLTINYMGIKA